MSLRVAAKGLDFHVELSPDLPRDVTVDPDKLRQVLINLIANAVKYTEAGEVSLEVRPKERESTGPTWLRFEVRDSGIGIREEDRDIIFSPFEQVCDQPATEAGTGLGLAISKLFVELMGGHIGLTSEPGEGTLFFFEIPVRIASGAGTHGADRRRGRITGLEAGQQRHRLLIAEDRLENRLLLSNLLEPLGFELREAVNGREAVEQFQEWNPHLIWMDIRMPVMDGLEATRRIKASEAGAAAKVVALTAHILEEESLEILEAGCDEVLRKPYRDTDIFEALTNHLGIRFLHADEEENQSAGTEEVVLTEKRLSTIPPDLIQTLGEAAALLSEEGCLDVAEKIDAHDAELGDTLRRMVKDMRYREILAPLDTVSGTGSR